MKDRGGENNKDHAQETRNMEETPAAGEESFSGDADRDLADDESLETEPGDDMVESHDEGNPQDTPATVTGEKEKSEEEAREERLEKRRKLWRDWLTRPLIILALLFVILSMSGVFNIPGYFVFCFALVMIVIALRLGGFLNLGWTMVLSTLAVMIPPYYIRSTYNLYMFFVQKFGTYPGDLWYCWHNYLRVKFPYPREYPSGIQMIFKFISKIRPEDFPYEQYIVWISVFLAVFALLTTYILYLLVKSTHKKYWKVWVFWILAPTFVWYGLYNMDFITLFTVVLGYYLFVEEEYYLSAAIIALGTAMKVFPVFLTPLLMFQCPKRELTAGLYNFTEKIPGFLQGLTRWVFLNRLRILSIITFILVWLSFNLPFMIREPEAWKYPYQWQIKTNFAKCEKDGSWFWIVYKNLERWEVYNRKNLKHGTLAWKIHAKAAPYYHHIGKISLLIYGFLYLWFLVRKWDLPFARKCCGVIILFILTDRIYSPQYNLYLLPFLVLVDYKFEKAIDRILFYTAFYLIEISGVAHTFFMFTWRETNWPYPQGIFKAPIPYTFMLYVLVKYLLLIYLFYVNWTAPVNPESKDWKDGGGKVYLKEKEKMEMEKALEEGTNELDGTNGNGTNGTEETGGMIESPA